MKIMLTGVGGFIGSNFATKAAREGIHVLGVDNFSDTLYSSAIKLYNLRKIELAASSFQFLEQDCRFVDSKLLDQEGIDAIVHFAALPGQIRSWDKFTEYVDSNIVSTERILQAIKNSKKKPRFIFISTSSVYGDLVTKESRLSGLYKPFSPYGVTKLAAENLVECYAQNFGLDFTILRLFSVFGPGQRPDMAISQFLSCLHRGSVIRVTGDGSQIRDFTFVDDVTDVVISSLTTSNLKTSYDVSGGISYSIMDVLQLCAKVTGIAPKVKFSARDIGDQLSTTGDTADTHLDLGLKNTVSLETGISLQNDHFLERNRAIGE